MGLYLLVDGNNKMTQILSPPDAAPLTPQLSSDTIAHFATDPSELTRTASGILLDLVSEHIDSIANVENVGKVILASKLGIREGQLSEHLQLAREEAKIARASALTGVLIFERLGIAPPEGIESWTDFRKKVEKSLSKAQKS